MRASEELNRLRKWGKLAASFDPPALANDMRRYGDPSNLAAEAQQAVAAVADDQRRSKPVTKRLNPVESGWLHVPQPTK